MNRQNKTEEFIGFYYMEDTSLCDGIIDVFKRSPKAKGGINIGANRVIVPEIKISTEVAVENDEEPEIKAYLLELQKCINLYVEDFKFSNAYCNFKLVEFFNIQMYNPNEGFFAWHTERGSAVPPTSNRHLVFMTYLNDVTDGGETEFYYQKIKVQPQKGLTLIWPADWTYTHRGIASPTQTKYIITGWLSYV